MTKFSNTPAAKGEIEIKLFFVRLNLSSRLTRLDPRCHHQKKAKQKEEFLFK